MACLHPEYQKILVWNGYKNKTASGLTKDRLFMPSYSEPREYEVILPLGTKFKVDKVETVKSHVSSWASMKVYWIRTMASDTKSVTPRPSTRI
jgi:hypothetical protein